MYESEEFQLFIRGPLEFHKKVDDLQKLSYSEILKVYVTIFKEYSSCDYSETYENIIDDAINYFTIGEEALDRFEQICKTNVDYFHSFETSHAQLIRGINDVTKFFSVNYGNQPLDLVPRESFSNPFFVLLDWIRWEVIDLAAINQAVKGKKELEKLIVKNETKLDAEKTQFQKLQMGKKSLSQILSTKSKEQNMKKLQDNTVHLQSEIEALLEINKIISFRLAVLEIPKFKKQKSKKYELILRSFAASSIQEFENIIQQTKEIEEKLNERANN